MNMHQKIRNFIESNLVVFEDEAVFSDSDNIFELGFVNSLFAMQLLNYVQNEFGIVVEDDDIDIANFSSVDNIVRLIERKRQETPA
ncbi:acyl carrier protein [candidate division KSB3 bacterium]|uniref:Acyl carrier protein n=1 Tax=candidate division KSB3 bacterium TaxID=2044937 RepID=A0A9D5JVB9_9BACT|nr:acyl carrier protein [candidate division KSB3 bacterium]MBD3324947.1 acyl carrier protein [candidate division KSB3 bacterium]